MTDSLVNYTTLVGRANAAVSSAHDVLHSKAWVRMLIRRGVMSGCLLVSTCYRIQRVLSLSDVSRKKLTRSLRNSAIACVN